MGQSLIKEQLISPLPSQEEEEFNSGIKTNYGPGNGLLSRPLSGPKGSLA